MKRLLPFIILIFLSSCNSIGIKKNSSSQIVKVKKPTISTLNIKGTTVNVNYPYDIEELKKLGFNTIIIETEGLRTSQKPYKTKFNTLKKLKKAINIANNRNINYIIEVTSGPGLSNDEGVNSFFENDIEVKYFTKMLIEIIERYKNSQGFKGISIKINNYQIDSYRYYSIMNRINEELYNKYNSPLLILNLHPKAFERDFDTVPSGKWKYINSTIHLDDFSYPGEGKSYSTSVSLNKNSLLESLKKLKKIKNSEIIVTLSIPWNKNSNILLQDIYEVKKILDFDLNISYGNGGDIYDFSKNESIIKVIKRHGK